MFWIFRHQSWFGCCVHPKCKEKMQEKREKETKWEYIFIKYVKFWVANVCLCHFCCCQLSPCAYVEIRLTWLTHSNNWCRLCTVNFFFHWWVFGHIGVGDESSGDAIRRVNSSISPVCARSLAHAPALFPHIYLSIECASVSSLSPSMRILLWMLCANRKNIKDTTLL